MRNRVKQFVIQQFEGIFRNAVEGVTQTVPVVLKGLEFDRVGGYRVAHDSIPDADIETYESGPIRNLDAFGNIILGAGTGNEGFLITNLGDSFPFAGSSVSGLERTLVPRVGTAAVLRGGPNDDEYVAGAIVETNADGWRDPARTSGITTSSVATSGAGLVAATYRALSIFFVPTISGLIAYQVETKDQAVASNEALRVEPSTALPVGYVAKHYARNPGVTANAFWGLESIKNEIRDRYSDGTVASLRSEFESPNANDLTTDALINFSSSSGLVEPHLERVWGVPADVPFVGPFYSPYNPEQSMLSGFSYQYASGFHFFETNGNITGLDSESGFTVKYNLYDQQALLSTYGAEELQHVYWFRHETSSGFLWGAGLAYEVDEPTFWGLARNVRTYAFVEIDGVKSYRSISSGNQPQNPIYFSVSNAPLFQFDVDLAAGTWDITRSYPDGTQFVSLTGNSLAAGTPTSMPTGGLQVRLLDWEKEPSADGDAFFEYEQKLLSARIEDSTNTLVAEVDVDDWDGAASSITTSGTQWDIVGDVSLSGGPPPTVASLDPRKTLVYSDIGYVNFASNVEQYIQINLLTSERITGVVSTPAGLLVMGNNEIFLVRSDPALNDFSVQRFSGTIGCDANRRPARMGGAVVFIWKGRLFGVTLGMGDIDFGGQLEEIGKPVYDPEDGFVEVVGEPARRHFVAKTESGLMYRYSVDDQKWMTDSYSGQQVTLVPNTDSLGTRYLLNTVSNNEVRHVRIFEASVEQDTPRIEWEDIDTGEDKQFKKLWRRVRVFVGDDYSGTPTLEYEIGGDSGTVTGTDERDGWWVFTFPHGLVNAKITSMALVLNGAELGDTLEPPIVVEYVPKYGRR